MVKPTLEALEGLGGGRRCDGSPFLVQVQEG